MYIIFIVFYLLINFNVVKNLELKHVPPENQSYIIEEGPISDGNETTYLVLLGVKPGLVMDWLLIFKISVLNFR